MLGGSDSSAGKQTLGVKSGGLITTTHWMGELTPRFLFLSLARARAYTYIHTHTTHDLKKKKKQKPGRPLFHSTD